jgi:rRNA pseudouridine-1189 N-methylase Emg1 (Nep1/Mra1 family)
MQNYERFSFLDLFEELFPAGEQFKPNSEEKFLKLAERFSLTEYLRPTSETEIRGY